ncbi:MAG TPA: extracellular solute-binding protein [Clostridiaceae bacterium]|jgi:raffinose/stachyose/melibiose transport system substrate-binding protein|nr:extracellular solute-binding protein [Clostridiaceae bacterium]
MKTFKKVLVFLTMIAILVSLAACGGKETTNTPGTSSPAASQSPSSEPGKDPVTINVFTNLSDRSAGQGKLEQMLLDNYVKENPHVTIKVEALQDEPYKQKFQSYVAGNNLPDFLSVWGQPSFLEAVMEKGYVAELNPDDYKDYGFFEGATTDFSYNGKLYGLPRNQDMTTLYINKGMFEANGVKIPTTYNELLDAARAFREKGIQPLTINGKDKWILNLFFQDLLLKVSGNQRTIYNASKGDTNFASDPDIRKAAELYKGLIDAGLFQDSFISADYGAAMNLFLQEQAAMFYMGAWEVGMASNPDNSESFRKNVDLIPFPVVEDGKGKATDIVAWNGGGYAVSASSPVKEEAIKLLNYMMHPDNWAKIGWQEGLVVPGQNYSSYLTGNENILQKGVTNILNTATSMSGTPWNDFKPGEWKSDVENIIQEFSAGAVSIDEFLSKLDEAAAK